MGNNQAEGDAAPENLGVLPSKLRLPRIRSNALWRRDLVDRLKGEAASCVVVRAAAGYGKTTLVRQWIHVEPRRCAWVTLDGGDNDPVVLLRHVVRALHEIEPLPDVEAALSTPSVALDAAALPALGAALEGDRQPVVLILDDVHLVIDPDAVAVIETLVDLVPDTSTIVLVGRSMPPAHLARRALGEDLLRLGRADLAFTESESRTLLAQALSGLAEPDVERLIERTEGWAAGLQLAVLALEDHPDPTSTIRAARGHNRRVADYFHEELMAHLPSSDRLFLMRTSVLSRLSGSLCDATLSEHGSGAVLERLAASTNLFVIALDDEPDWYRYHHLFADLLQSQLRQHAPEEEPELRRRAAEWLSSHGHAHRAVTQALATGDAEFAAGILYRHLFGTLVGGRIATLERWLGAFSPDDTRQRAPLALAAGWLALMTGRARDVDHWLEILESADTDDYLPDDTLRFDVAREALAMTSGHGGAKQTLQSARVVKDAGPETNPWFVVASQSEAVATAVTDPSADPVELFESAEFATRGVPPAHSAALSQLALAHLQRGDQDTGQALAQQAVDELADSRLENHPMVAAVPCVRAYAAARRGAVAESARASEHGTRILESVNDAIPRAGIQLRLVLADAACLLCDYSLAETHLRQAEALLPAEPDAAVLVDWADRLHETVSRGTSDNGVAVAFTEAELRVLGQLATHRTLEEIGEHLYVSRNTVKSHAISIYRKFGVSRRSDAVERAHDLGLLDHVAEPD